LIGINVIAGILIGIANDTWFARLVVPFGWGFVFLIYVWVVDGKRRNAIISAREAQGGKAKWGMSHVQAFYFVEYMTAVFTSLSISVIAGFIKGLF